MSSPTAKGADCHEFRMGIEYVSTPIELTWVRKFTGYHYFYCSTCGIEKSGVRTVVQSVWDDHIARFGPRPEVCMDMQEVGEI